MTFWRRFKHSSHEKAPSRVSSNITIMQSDSLGMTVIEEGQSCEMNEISQAEWVDILNSRSLTGFPFERIYFSFLKGIPAFLRLKIWLLLCTENNSRNFKYTAQNQQEYESKQKIILKELTLTVYQHLSSGVPKEKESEQILKDVHRSYANNQSYKYTSPLLKKLLFTLSNSGIEYSQGMNYILLNIIIMCLDSLGLNEATFDALTVKHERDMFVILRETIVRLEIVFGGQKITQVLRELQQKIAESVPEILFQIYSMGMDCFSMFSHNYYSIMSYNNPPKQICSLMMDLFYLVGEKAIHAMILRMLEMSAKEITSLKDPEKLQNYVKKDMYHRYFEAFKAERASATKLQDFGLSFFQNIQHMKI